MSANVIKTIGINLSLYNIFLATIVVIIAIFYKPDKFMQQFLGNEKYFSKPKNYKFLNNSFFTFNNFILGVASANYI